MNIPERFMVTYKDVINHKAYTINLLEEARKNHIGLPRADDTIEPVAVKVNDIRFHKRIKVAMLEDEKVWSEHHE